MKFRLKAVGALVLSMAMLTGISACSSGDSSSESNGKTVITFWHNSTTGEGKAYWEKVAKAFEKKHSTVDIRIQTIQNEDLDGKLQTALQDEKSAPDIFLARGGQKTKDMADAGQLMDLTNLISDNVRTNHAAALKGVTFDKKVYAVPMTTQPEGFWYSKDLFKKAGISKVPTTINDLYSVVRKLKAAGISPIALGAKDAWPAAHWYYSFALRECSDATFATTMKTMKFTDPCWTKAGHDVKKFADIKPFNEGFLTTSAQQGAGSSASLVANHKAAMELMGTWDPGVMGDLTPDKKLVPDLGYFPFPEVPGGKGEKGAMMGGSDGYAVYIHAPKEAADFLNFAAQKENQEAYANAFHTIPANTQAQGVVTYSALKDVLKYYSKAPAMYQYLDTQFGSNVGNAMNEAVVNLLAGKGTPEQIVSATNAAAQK